MPKNLDKLERLPEEKLRMISLKIDEIITKEKTAFQEVAKKQVEDLLLKDFDSVEDSVIQEVLPPDFF